MITPARGHRTRKAAAIRRAIAGTCQRGREHGIHGKRRL
nr:MAG TPA: hypothetical protein [Caudoviricetes sp.]